MSWFLETIAAICLVWCCVIVVVQTVGISAMYVSNPQTKHAHSNNLSKAFATFPASLVRQSLPSLEPTPLV